MAHSIYEHVAWQSMPDQAMRPGGLLLTTQALQYCRLPVTAFALDLGCGNAATLRYLSSTYGWTCLGVDYSAGILQRTQQLDPKLMIVQGMAEHLPLVKECMDLILCECVLSIFQMEQVLVACRRILKPGGYLLISDLFTRNENGLEALRQFPVGTSISGAMSQVEISKAVEKQGLRIELWKDCSDVLKDFPVCTLMHAAGIDPFELHIAAAKAKLGYYYLIARKRAE